MKHPKNPRTKYLIIIPITKSVSWDWSADYIRQTVMTLSRLGYRVLVYLDSNATFFLKKPQIKFPYIKNVIFHYPKYILPFKRFEKILEINRAFDFNSVCERYGKGKQIMFWTFNPVSPAILDIVLKRKEIVSLYDCVDYCGDDDDKKIDFRLHLSEDDLINKVDFFFVNSLSLMKLHEKKRPGHVVPQGFALDVYKKTIKNKIDLPNEKPVVGFVGSIDARIDFSIVLTVVNKFKNLNFVFWGPVDEKYFDSNLKLKKQLNSLLSQKNVIFGQSLRDKIPGLINQFDVGIIPYNLERKFCKYCYPMKLFEYFYLGKHVIASPVEELKRFPDLITVCKNKNEWVKAINIAIKGPLKPKIKTKQKHLSVQNSWDRKIVGILRAVGAARSI